jgi:hypothetical protein
MDFLELPQIPDFLREAFGSDSSPIDFKSLVFSRLQYNPHSNKDTSVTVRM